jgi:hypothetical protein
MNRQKTNIVERTRRGGHGMTAVLLSAGFLMNVSLSAQQSAGHTVTIRIVRPVYFSVESVQNPLQAGAPQAGGALKVSWRSDSTPKKVAVSRTGDDPASGQDLFISDGDTQNAELHLMACNVGEPRINASRSLPGNLTTSGYAGSNSGGGPVVYTVMDI